MRIITRLRQATTPRAMEIGHTHVAEIVCGGERVWRKFGNESGLVEDIEALKSVVSAMVEDGWTPELMREQLLISQKDM